MYRTIKGSTNRPNNYIVRDSWLQVSPVVLDLSLLLLISQLEIFRGHSVCNLRSRSTLYIQTITHKSLFKCLPSLSLPFELMNAILLAAECLYK